MSEHKRSLPEDAPMLLSPVQIAAFVIVFLLFMLLGRVAGGWLQGGTDPGSLATPPTPTATIELAETLEPA